MESDPVDSDEAESVRGSRVAASGVPISAASASDAGAPEVKQSAESVAAEKSGGPSNRRTLTYLAMAVAIVLVVVVVAAYALNGEFRPTSSSSSSGVVLIPEGTGYSMPIGQFIGTYFTVSQESRITGALNSSEGIQIYVLTQAEFARLAQNLTVSTYEWASGAVADQVVYHLNVTVPPGQWVLSFVNPNVSWPTGVGFYSDVVVAPV